MRRRRVLAGLGLATVGLSLSPRLGWGQGQPASLKPPRLQPGDTVGIISPAGVTMQRDRLDLVIDAVKALGLVPKVGSHTLARYGYLAGPEQDRAADVNAMFADPIVAALMPIRGDWGSARILPYLDYDQIRANPKVLIGFSDITALLLGIYAKTGLTTFHGPHGLTAWRADQVEPLCHILMQGEQLTYTNPLGNATTATSTQSMRHAALRNIGLSIQKPDR